VKKISKRLAGPIAVLIAIAAIAGVIILWPIICAAGYLLQALAGILLFIGFIGLTACQFANKKVRIYTGLAFTVMLEGRAFAGKWPFDPETFYHHLPTFLTAINKLHLSLCIIPIGATIISLATELTIHHVQKKRPAFIPESHEAFDYETHFLFVMSPVFFVLVMLYAFACGLIA
jgi:hypothetical protein